MVSVMGITSPLSARTVAEFEATLLKKMPSDPAQLQALVEESKTLYQGNAVASSNVQTKFYQAVTAAISAARSFDPNQSVETLQSWLKYNQALANLLVSVVNNKNSNGVNRLSAYADMIAQRSAGQTIVTQSFADGLNYLTSTIIPLKTQIASTLAGLTGRPVTDQITALQGLVNQATSVFSKGFAPDAAMQASFFNALSTIYNGLNKVNDNPAQLNDLSTQLTQLSALLTSIVKTTLLNATQIATVNGWIPLLGSFSALNKFRIDLAAQTSQAKLSAQNFGTRISTISTLIAGAQAKFTAANTAPTQADATSLYSGIDGGGLSYIYNNRDKQDRNGLTQLIVLLNSADTQYLLTGVQKADLVSWVIQLQSDIVATNVTPAVVTPAAVTSVSTPATGATEAAIRDFVNRVGQTSSYSVIQKQGIAGYLTLLQSYLDEAAKLFTSANDVDSGAVLNFYKLLRSANDAVANGNVASDVSQFLSLIDNTRKSVLYPVRYAADINMWYDNLKAFLPTLPPAPAVVPQPVVTPVVPPVIPAPAVVPPVIVPVVTPPPVVEVIPVPPVVVTPPSVPIVPAVTPAAVETPIVPPAPAVVTPASIVAPVAVETPVVTTPTPVVTPTTIVVATPAPAVVTPAPKSVEDEVIQPRGFYQEEGSAVSVAVGSRRGELEVWMVDLDGDLCRYDNYSMALNPWVKMTSKTASGSDLAGVLQGVSISSDGDLGVLDNNGHAYLYDWNRKLFTLIKNGPGNQDLVIDILAVGDRKNIWAVDLSNGNLLKYAGNRWEIIEEGGVANVSVGFDGTVVSLNDTGEAYRYLGKDAQGEHKWDDLPGPKLTTIAVGDKDSISGIGENGELYTFKKGRWMLQGAGKNQPSKGFMALSMNAVGTTYLLDNDNGIYANDDLAVLFTPKGPRPAIPATATTTATTTGAVDGGVATAAAVTPASSATGSVTTPATATTSTTATTAATKKELKKSRKAARLAGQLPVVVKKKAGKKKQAKTARKNAKSPVKIGKKLSSKKRARKTAKQAVVATPTPVVTAPVAVETPAMVTPALTPATAEATQDTAKTKTTKVEKKQQRKEARKQARQAAQGASATTQEVTPAAEEAA